MLHSEILLVGEQEGLAPGQLMHKLLAKSAVAPIFKEIVFQLFLNLVQLQKGEFGFLCGMGQIFFAGREGLP